MSITEALSQVARTEGVRALWKGNGVTIVHRLPYSAINFFTYEQLMLNLSVGRPGPHREDASAAAVVRCLPHARLYARPRLTRRACRATVCLLAPGLA
jgi:hypothetical protein